MTERLYYTDSYLRNFTARVVELSADGATVYLDRTAFYPTSGGQPFDTGSIAGVPVVDIFDEGARIAHRLAGTVPCGEVDCRVDWTRRFDHMQQHTGQHLLTAVFEELFRLKTVSFHLSGETATIDLEGPVELQMAVEAERRANQLVAENRTVLVHFEDAANVQGLRKASERTGPLRIVSIDSLDRSACGGTHVRATGEIGAVLLRKLERTRQNTRVEFLCGGRAVRRARADFDALAKAAQHFSAPLDEVPALVASQLESARAVEKAQRKLQMDLAAYQGKDLYQATAADPDGIRRYTRRLNGGTLDELRALAQSFTAQSKSIFIGVLAAPPSVLLAVSADSGIDAGKTLTAAIVATGGRGGGTSRMAQGSVPNAEMLDQVLAKL